MLKKLKYQFYEDLQDLLELRPEKDVLFIIGDWNASYLWEISTFFPWTFCLRRLSRVVSIGFLVVIYIRYTFL